MTRLTLTCAVLLTVSVATTPAQATCNRACLTGFVDTYFKALAANDPAAVPLAPSAKPTLNGKAVRLADAFWASADRTIYRWDMMIRTIRAGFQMIRYTTSPRSPIGTAMRCYRRAAH